MDTFPLELAKDLPFAAIFAWFLWLSFRQRKETMLMMRDIVKDFTKVISDCCDDDGHQFNERENNI